MHGHENGDVQMFGLRGDKRTESLTRNCHTEILSVCERPWSTHVARGRSVIGNATVFQPRRPGVAVLFDLV